MTNWYLRKVLSELRMLVRKQVYPDARKYFENLADRQKWGIEEAEQQRIVDRMAGLRNLDFFEDEMGRPDDDFDD
jgi:hypothetical protein